MKFVGGSPLSDDELAAVSQSMVDTYGEAARDVLNGLIDDANERGDFVEHASWVNVSLGVLQLLRPGQRWNTQ